MIKVNTFIVGAPKAGTTSLYNYLNNHDEVCMSCIKEPNFFSSKEVSNLFYKATSINNVNSYQKLFPEEKIIIGEASVSYLFYEDVPKRIYDYNSKAKIIIMLRHPIDRAFSHFLMDKRLGFCKLTFEQILNDPNKYLQYFQQYLKLGLYHDQVKRYLDMFGCRQVKIILYEDFKKNSSQVMSDTFKFLKINDISLDYEIHNPFLSPSNLFLDYLYKFKFVRRIVKTFLPLSLIKLIKFKFFESSSKPLILKDTKQKLNDFYKDDVVQLEKLLKKDLSQWDIK